MSLVVLRSGFDWLETSYSGQVTEESAARLDSAKLLAQAHDTGYPFELFPVELMAQPSAYGKWSWVLRSPEFDIRAQRASAKGSACASLRLSSFGLTNTAPKQLQDIAESCLEQLGTMRPLTVSRVDVCVDFQGWVPTAADMSGMVCRGKKNTIGTDEADETFARGMGGPVKFRLYNKTEEIRSRRGKKDFFFDAWRLSGRYDETLPVWRAEIEVRRSVLKELGLDLPSQVLASPGAILDFGLGWANLRTPTGDKTRSRWPEDPRWTELRKATFDGVPLQRVIRPPALMDLDTTIRRFIGLVATAGVYFEDDRYMAALQRLSFAAEARIMQDKIDFPETVELKRRRLLSNN